MCAPHAVQEDTFFFSFILSFVSRVRIQKKVSTFQKVKRHAWVWFMDIVNWFHHWVIIHDIYFDKTLLLRNFEAVKCRFGVSTSNWCFWSWVITRKLSLIKLFKWQFWTSDLWQKKLICGRILKCTVHRMWCMTWKKKRFLVDGRQKIQLSLTAGTAGGVKTRTIRQWKYFIFCPLSAPCSGGKVVKALSLHRSIEAEVLGLVEKLVDSQKAIHQRRLLSGL